MTRLILFTFLTFVTVGAINRPVYKINLTQKGFAQVCCLYIFELKPKQYEITNLLTSDFCILLRLVVTPLYRMPRNMWTYLKGGDPGTLGRMKSSVLSRLVINTSRVFKVTRSFMPDTYRCDINSFQCESHNWELA